MQKIVKTTSKQNYMISKLPVYTFLLNNRTVKKIYHCKLKIINYLIILLIVVNNIK